MSRFFTVLGVMVLLAGVNSVSAATESDPISLTQPKKQTTTEKVKVLSESNVTPVGLKLPQREAGVTRAQELVNEDFSNVPDGATEKIGNLTEPRYTTLIASRYFEPGRYIQNEYTPESGTWEGDFVYAGKGGSVVMQCYNPSVPAVLNTPLGDYSGDITVKIRARWSRTFWNASYFGGDPSQYASTDGSAFNVFVRTGGFDSDDIPANDMDPDGYLQSGRIYEADGWTEFTFTFRNEGAAKDGYISIQTGDAIEIDYIKVTDAATYLACPTVRPLSGFNSNGFTINWDPVRRSYDYYIDLWEVNYTAPSSINENYNFEDGQIPAGITCEGAEVVAGIGKDESYGLRLGGNGVENALVLPDYGSMLGSCRFNVMFEINDNTQVDPEWYLGTLMVEGLTSEGWQQLASITCDGFFYAGNRYFNFIVDGEEFEGRYSSLRFCAYGLGDQNHVVIDNIALWAPRPYELVRVRSNQGFIIDPENDDNPYNYYCHTAHNDPCTYTFTNLNPDSEYWYRIRSHNVGDFTIGEKHHAFGVAAPQLLPATNVAYNSYTANWTDAPKAQNFIIRNFKIEEAAESEDDKVIFHEVFSGCPEGDMVPVDASESLDSYTDMPGWTGENVYVGNNLMGGVDYSGTYLTTPILPVKSSRGSYTVYVDAFGYSGDSFCMTFNKAGLDLYATFDEDGHLSGTLEMEQVMDGETITFSSRSDLSFALAEFEVSQNVEEGDLISTFHSAVEVPAGTGQYTFSGLENSNFYGYQVISRYDLEKETVYSATPDMMVVDMNNGAAVGGIEIGSEAVEVGRYDLTGARVDKEYKGIVIIKMSDGSVYKTIEK